ncbi:MAG: glycine oxidase ThiO [Pseudomonadota bacterium]
MNVAIIGAGVAGLCCAVELLRRGFTVDVYERADSVGADACSWFAGGMLAPWCERESAEQAVVDLGARAIDWWSQNTLGVSHNGSLVLSMQRDKRDIERFARLTENHCWVDADAIRNLEPDLETRFERGLFFEQEAHLNPRAALAQLSETIEKNSGRLHFNCDVNAVDFSDTQVVDCRGFSARHDLPGLRGVKGEMLILQTREVTLSRPIRLVHPRYPVYLVPRHDDQIMLGATMVENDERSRISARSMLELLSAAYALHPALGEAEIVEIGVDVRPAFSDNLPAVCRKENVVYVNGLFRHGFLLSPAMAQRVANVLSDQAQFAELAECA